MRDRVIVVCISGRAGVSSPSGMTNLRDKLRESLLPLGVVSDNIFRRSWNHNEDDNPFGAPWVSDLNREINQRTEDPTYLALIGHSYGAWAACRLSNATNRVPDFVALIDPVFGPTNTDPVRPMSSFVKSWYQRKGIKRGDCFGIGKIPCVSASNGISCGYHPVPGADENQEEEFVKNWDGEIQTANCPFGEVPVEESHVSLDDNQWIWHSIHDKLVDDIQALPEGWTPIPEERVSLSVGTDKQIWSIDANGEISRWNGHRLDHISGQLTQVSVGSDGEVWGVNRDAQIFRYTTAVSGSVGYFENIQGSLTHVSVGNHANIWGVNSHDEIFRWNGQTFDRVPGFLRQLSVGSDGSVWGVNAIDDIYRWNGKEFDQIPGKLKAVAVGCEGKVWGINSSNELYRWDACQFHLVPEGKLIHVSVGSDGAVWGMNKNHRVFRRQNRA